MHDMTRGTGRTLRRALLVVLVLPVLAAVLVVAAAVLLPGGDEQVTRSRPATDAAALSSAAGSDRTAVITALQEHLREQPRDARSWAGLGVHYVEQARLTADPTYYPKAERVLDRSLRLQPRDNDLALAGRATLAAARHDFTAALRWADRALAVNAYGILAHLARTDALVELGRYDEASAAARQADEIRPGLGTFARLSYLAELRGSLATARRHMRRALDDATVPADRAFASGHLGDLARASGDVRTAARSYAAALDASPGYVPALVGRAHLALARGDVRAARRDLERVATLQPTPDHLAALGELEESTGRTSAAREQYRLVREVARFAQAQGVRTDLETALVEADHGSAVTSLRLARGEWQRRRSIHVADALGWALHASGRDAEALRYARLATRLGTRDASLLYHRGVIEQELGLDRSARRHLAAAVRVDAGFSPLRALDARERLAALTSSAGAS